MTPFDFGSSEELLRYIQEKSDDIERVVIIPPGAVVTYMGVPQAPIEEFKAMLYLCNGERKVIGTTDAEILLNDGILNRMKLKIEFLKKK